VSEPGRAARSGDWRGTLVLVGLLVVYAAVLGGWGRAGSSPFEPLASRPHAIEQLIVAGRYSEALPQIRELHDRYPREWLVAMWLARAHHGLGHWRDEAGAWEQFVKLSPAPEEACPALPQAYERLGSQPLALDAYERCARFDPADAGPVADLAGAYLRAGRRDDALETFRRAAALDPDDPAIERQVASLERRRPADVAAAGQP
jgi:tetratricopeptide (TPR) repeat protein